MGPMIGMSPSTGIFTLVLNVSPRFRSGCVVRIRSYR